MLRALPAVSASLLAVREPSELELNAGACGGAGEHDGGAPHRHQHDDGKDAEDRDAVAAFRAAVEATPLHAALAAAAASREPSEGPVVLPCAVLTRPSSGGP